jgi:hypothetical protein
LKKSQIFGKRLCSDTNSGAVKSPVPGHHRRLHSAHWNAAQLDPHTAAGRYPGDVSVPLATKAKTCWACMDLAANAIRSAATRADSTVLAGFFNNWTIEILPLRSISSTPPAKLHAGGVTGEYLISSGLLETSPDPS